MPIRGFSLDGRHALQEGFLIQPKLTSSLNLATVDWLFPRKRASPSELDAKVAEFHGGALGVFVEEATFQISSPVAQPRQAPARKILDEGTKDGPVGVGVLVILMSSCQISEQLYPRKPEARDAR